MSIRLTDKISAFPVRHGRAPFAMELRKLLWNQGGNPSERFDAFAFALPAALRREALEGAEALPIIRSLVIRVDGSVRAYFPFDPCDAYVEALRQAGQRRLPVEFLEDNALFEGPLIQSLPDAYLANGIGMDRYLEVAKQILATQGVDDRLEHRGYVVSAGLRRMEKRFGRILLLCDFPLLGRLQELFQEGSIAALLAEAENRDAGSAAQGASAAQAESATAETVDIRAYPVKPGLVYFAMGELPFYAGEMEKERQNPLAGPMDYLELVKRIFVETRNKFITEPGEAEAISIKKIQAALVFLRNMAVQQGRLTPDLLDVVSAAKGVFGNAFAAKVLEAARFYPFLDPLDLEEDQLEIGRDHIREPGEGEPADAGQPVVAFNMLEDEPKVWKTINLKKEPDREKQRRYRYAWDPRGMCSHTPEDERIEGFNRAVRRRSQDLDLQGFARTEKLTSSLKDGIDIRETLRNWTTGGIYVKEIPPAKGRVDTVVIIFDEDNDDRYPSRTTWYAEHDEESTLTFFATDPLVKLIGPGIAESEYGGLSLLFPPRPVRNVFEMPLEEFGFHSLSEQLLYGALLNSEEKSVAYVANRKPGLRMKRMAAGFKKRLVWVPMASFSAETLRRLRKFHILNGKQVRAWASRFIPE
ncbi:MAG: hypothetical protein JWO30_2422 [Fibrobacteres bacterium]|nr:hypothetical protein [Fibrobacterota bacterium]